MRGAIIAISSTTIIVKAFAEHGVRGRVAELVFGILIIEDLIAIFLLVILTALSSAGGISPATIGVTALRLTTFLAGLLGVGLLVVPRLMRAVVRLERPETTLVASIGICFAFAELAWAFGFSVALGAFVAGSLIAESGTAKVVEQLVHPVRDMFAAIFFVSVGMMIDPARVVDHWGAVLAFSAVVIVGNLFVVTTSAFLTGVDTRTSVQAGMSLAQIGEFSFIIAGLGLATGATGAFLYPVAIAVSALTTLTTPVMIRAAPLVSSFVDRSLPRPLQTFVALYATWIEPRESGPRERDGRSYMHRLVRLLLLDFVVLAGVVIGVALEATALTALLHSRFGLSAGASRLMMIVGVGVVAVPLVFGFVATAQRLAMAIAARAFPGASRGAVDAAAAPRRALVTVLQMAIVLLAAIPLVAITQPFLPPLRGVAVLVVTIALFGVAFWRSATNLQGHARAGAEIIAATLAKQMARPASDAEVVNTSQQLDAVLPGLGHPMPVRLPDDSPLIGKSLAKTKLRAATGATIIAIGREGGQVLVPSGREVLRAGDVLALVGTHGAIKRARAMLRGG